MFAQEIGIDLGSANAVVVARRRGIIAKEPTVIAVNRRTKAVVAVGIEAWRMIGRTPDTIVSIRPVRAGVVSDLDHSTALLKHLLRKIAGSRWLRPRLLLTVRTNASEVEKRALAEAAAQAGAGEVLLMEETVAAALGAGLPVDRPVGSMLVDVGCGTTQAAVISLGGVVVTGSCMVAGDEMDEAVARSIRREHNLLIGSPTAERVKMEFGAALPGARHGQTMIVGRQLATGNPMAINIEADEVFAALKDSLARIDALVLSVLAQTPPDLMADISRSGIMLTGGGALLPGMAERLVRLTGLPVRLADAPQEAVALGTAQVLENPGRFSLYRVRGARGGK
jgi:rod shape-determining protein MreB and related proteins